MSYGTYESDWDVHEYAAAIKARFSIVAVIGETVRLKKVGKEYKGCCPFHDDKTPSLSVREDWGWFRCFGCEAAGDVINFVQRSEGLTFFEAMRKLEMGTYVPRPPLTFEPRDDDRIRIAREMWAAARPIEDTPAMKYLESRGFPSPFIADQENLRSSTISIDGSAKKHPVLMAAARGVDGEITGVQCTFLTEDGAKLQESSRRSYGVIAGSAIRLQSVAGATSEPSDVWLCEGLEDGLSLARLYEEATVWATLGAGNLPNITLPNSCSEVTIAGDNDESGRKASELAVSRYGKEGYEVKTNFPPADFKDWNEFLMHWEFEEEYGEGNRLPWRYWYDGDAYDEEGNCLGLSFPPELRPAANFKAPL